MNLAPDLRAPIFSSDNFMFDEDNPRPPHFDMPPEPRPSCEIGEVVLFGVDPRGERYPLAARVPLYALAGLVRARVRCMQQAGCIDPIFQFDPSVGNYHKLYA